MICISHKFPDDVNSDGSGATLGEPLAWLNSLGRKKQNLFKIHHERLFKDELNLPKTVRWAPQELLDEF